MDQLTKQISTYAGMWVAVLDDQVVEVRESPWALLMALHDRDIVGATVMRAPEGDAVELVGLG